MNPIYWTLKESQVGELEALVETMRGAVRRAKYERGKETEVTVFIRPEQFDRLFGGLCNAAAESTGTEGDLRDVSSSQAGTGKVDSSGTDSTI